MNRSANVDERAASWKVLLPLRPTSRILALGLEPEEMAGLMRSYPNIETSPNGGCHDAVITGNDVSLAECVQYIGKAGILVQIGTNGAKDNLPETGLPCVREYAALPPNKPRLFIPTISRRFRSKGLEFHSAGSTRARVSLAAARLLSQFGITKHLRRRTVRLYSPTGRLVAGNPVTEWISERVGWPVAEMVVYAGSDSPRRKMTLLCLSADCEKEVIAKIADTPQAIAAVKQEAGALREISHTELADCVPRLMTEGQCGPYYVQVQSSLPKGNHGQSTVLAESHFSFLTAISRIGRTEVPLRMTSTWKGIADAASSASANLPEPVGQLMGYCTRVDPANTLVTCHRTHGDFAPWNIICQRNSLLVYDWEDSRSDGYALHDIFHFIYRQSSLVGPWRGAAPVLAMMTESASRVARISELQDKLTVALMTWCMNEYMASPSPHIIELATLIGQRTHG